MCYAFTTAYDMVVTIPLTSVPNYSKNLVDYVSKFLDMTVITKVNKIEIKGTHPELSGVSIDTAYGIKSTAVEDSEQTVQDIWNVATGEQLTSDRVDNFKLIYGDIINIQLTDEIDVSNIEEEKLIASVTVSYTDGTSKTFDFYAYTSTRCYYKINGEFTKGHTFSVSRDNVEKLIRDIYNFEQGYTLDPNI